MALHIRDRAAEPCDASSRRRSRSPVREKAVVAENVHSSHVPAEYAPDCIMEDVPNIHNSFNDDFYGQTTASQGCGSMDVDSNTGNSHVHILRYPSASALQSVPEEFYWVMTYATHILTSSLVPSLPQMKEVEWLEACFRDKSLQGLFHSSTKEVSDSSLG